MGIKRPFAELGSPDREQDASGADTHGPSPSAKKYKHGSKGKHKAKEGSVEWAKKRARTIERLFHSNKELPANVQNDLERELAAHKSTVAEKAFQKRRSSMISKYHMVRFFERKKAMRLAKQLRRKIEQSSDAHDREQLQADLHVAEVDESYALNFPHAEPYISMYNNFRQEGTEEEGDEQRPAPKTTLEMERPPMWSTIEKAMEQGPDALRRLRERRAPGDGPDNSLRSKRGQPKRTEAKPRAAISKQQKQAATDKLTVSEKEGNQPQLNRRERRRLMRKAPPDNASDEEDDGGGFFQED